MSENKNLQGITSKEVAAMNSTEAYPSQGYQDKEVDLTQLWSAIWSGKITIIIVSFLFASASILYALNQPDIYRASTLLAPASEQGGASGLANMAGQFGGLASLAGINISGGATDKTGLALEVLKSRLFIEEFINKHKLLVPLFAVESWNSVEDQLNYDNDVYDVNSKQWLREAKKPLTAEPTRWESYEAFSKLFSVSTNKDTGMVTIAIEYYSPNLAKQWLLWIVEDLNTTIREKDKAEAQTSIDFLTTKLQETQVADMQTVFYQLIEEQTKTIMLAEVSQEYVLKTIDPANAPDNKAKPKRSLIVILGTMLGGILAVIYVIVRYFLNDNPDKE